MVFRPIWSEMGYIFCLISLIWVWFFQRINYGALSFTVRSETGIDFLQRLVWNRGQGFKVWTAHHRPKWWLPPPGWTLIHPKQKMILIFEAGFPGPSQVFQRSSDKIELLVGSLLSYLPKHTYTCVHMYRSVCSKTWLPAAQNNFSRSNFKGRIYL